MIPKNLKITHEELLTVLDYNPETGAMKWRDGQTNARHAKHHREFGWVDDKGRKYVHINQRAYAAHRLAWFYVTKSWPEAHVAPVNGDYLDLRFENLTLETPSQTAMRGRQRKNNTSGMRGVCWDKSRNKWIVIFKAHGQTRNLGRFDTKEEASAAYEKARAEVLGATPLTPEQMAQKREVTRLYARYRSLWKRTQRFAGGLTGWASVQEFKADIGQNLRDRLDLAPIDSSKPIGPGNWKWEETLFSKFDTSTNEGRRAYERAVKQKNPHLWRDRNFRQLFGITLAQYHQMLEAQGGACATCKNSETRTRGGKVTWLAVDHCHKNGHVRGLLCSACNQAIGLMKDSPTVLRAAADYLERHAMKTTNGAASPPSLEEERNAHHGYHSPERP